MFRLIFHITNTLCSTYVSAGALPEEVEAALEGLEPTGDLTVTRTNNSENGYDWQVRVDNGLLKDSHAVVHFTVQSRTSLRHFVSCLDIDIRYLSYFLSIVHFVSSVSYDT